MKTTMKKSIVYLLAVLLVFQIVPAFADQYTGSYTPGYVIFREKLEIIAGGSGAILAVGSTVQLGCTDGYDDIVWSSDNPEVATVENGLVTAIAAGQVKITVTAEKGSYSDSITFRIMGASVSEDNEKDAEEKLVIIVSGAKTKVEYDGNNHVNTYSVSCSNEELYDASKLHVAEEGLASGLECWTYQDNLTATYDDENAEVVVSNGWLQIKPSAITVKADDVTVVNDEENPAFTVTVTSGLVEGEEIDFSNVEFTTLEQNGTTYIQPNIQKGQVFGNYKVSKVESGILTVRKIPNHPLYNIAKINGTYYRLAKTEIWTEKKISENLGKTLKAEDYIVNPYNFEDLTITINGKDYVYNCQANSGAIVDGANYYDIKLLSVSIVKQKIGAMDGTKPRWIVPEDQRYDDPNNINSIHRDFEITLHENLSPAVEQTAYTMLSVDGSKDYYKLPTTTIKAQPIEKVKNGYLKDGEYKLEPYDFSNTVITIDGVEYRYNDGSLTEYDNYFTVTFETVDKNEMFNRNEKWFNSDESWLDGAREQYGDLPIKTTTFHANYAATTHKAEQRERSVTISSDWPEGKIAYPGAKITLTAELQGFSENVTLQWQYSTDLENWTDELGANGISHTYILDEMTARYYWRIAAEDAN